MTAVKKLPGMVFNSYSLVVNIGAIFTKARIATASVFLTGIPSPREKLQGIIALFYFQ